MVCNTCAGKHNELGPGTSLIKSLNLDDWAAEEIELMQKGGNQRFEEYTKINNVTLSFENITTVYAHPAIERYRRKLDPRRIVESNGTIKHDTFTHNTSAVGVQRPPVWVSNEIATVCMLCNNNFSWFCRKHHCRRCGKVVCGVCAPKKNARSIPEWGFVQPVRHCIVCYESPPLQQTTPIKNFST